MSHLCEYDASSAFSGVKTGALDPTRTLDGMSGVNRCAVLEAALGKCSGQWFYRCTYPIVTVREAAAESLTGERRKRFPAHAKVDAQFRFGISFLSISAYCSVRPKSKAFLPYAGLSYQYVTEVHFI